MENEILSQVETLLKGFSKEEQVDFLWEVIRRTSFKDVSMEPVYNGYEIFLEVIDNK